MDWIQFFLSLTNEATMLLLPTLDRSESPQYAAVESPPEQEKRGGPGGTTSLLDPIGSPEH